MATDRFHVDGRIARLTILDPPTQAEVQALRDACEELADDVRALSALVHALQGAVECRETALTYSNPTSEGTPSGGAGAVGGLFAAGMLDP